MTLYEMPEEELADETTEEDAPTLQFIDAEDAGEFDCVASDGLEVDGQDEDADTAESIDDGIDIAEE